MNFALALVLPVLVRLPLCPSHAKVFVPAQKPFRGPCPGSHHVDVAALLCKELRCRKLLQRLGTNERSFTSALRNAQRLMRCTNSPQGVRRCRHLRLTDSEKAGVGTARARAESAPSPDVATICLFQCVSCH